LAGEKFSSIGRKVKIFHHYSTSPISNKANKPANKRNQIMWKILNSPIVITAIVILALFSYTHLKEDTTAGEMRSAYTELLAIAEDAKNDLEKKELIKGLVVEAGEQVKEAFSFFDNEEDRQKEAEENRVYFETKKLIEVTSPKIIEKKQFSDVEKFIVYSIANQSDRYLGKIAHTIEFYRDEELVYVRDEWGNVKLAPGESMSYSFNVDKEEPPFDQVKITVYEISLLDVSK